MSYRRILEIDPEVIGGCGGRGLHPLAASGWPPPACGDARSLPIRSLHCRTLAETEMEISLEVSAHIVQRIRMIRKAMEAVDIIVISDEEKDDEAEEERAIETEIADLVHSDIFWNETIVISSDDDEAEEEEVIETETVPSDIFWDDLEEYEV